MWLIPIQKRSKKLLRSNSVRRNAGSRQGYARKQRKRSRPRQTISPLLLIDPAHRYLRIRHLAGFAFLAAGSATRVQEIGLFLPGHFLRPNFSGCARMLSPYLGGRIHNRFALHSPEPLPQSCFHQFCLRDQTNCAEWFLSWSVYRTSLSQVSSALPL